MSVFRVKLNNIAQGLLDKDPSTASAGNLGSAFTTSLQRTVFIAGPHRMNRLLKDGDTFTDSNYYKRYAYPQVALSDAILEVVSDDGSVYSDIESENTYPKTYDFVCGASSDFEDNVADIAGDTGGFAVFTQIKNKSSNAIRIRLNGVAVIDLASGATQILNSGDLSVTLVEIENDNGSTSAVQVFISVRSQSNS